MSNTGKTTDDQPRKNSKTGITHKEPKTELTTDYDKIEKAAEKTPARNYKENLEETVKTTDTSVDKLMEKIDETGEGSTAEETDDSTPEERS